MILIKDDLESMRDEGDLESMRGDEGDLEYMRGDEGDMKSMRGDSIYSIYKVNNNYYYIVIHVIINFKGNL